jgi:hypothetical protein
MIIISFDSFARLLSKKRESSSSSSSMYDMFYEREREREREREKRSERRVKKKNYGADKSRIPNDLGKPGK